MAVILNDNSEEPSPDARPVVDGQAKAAILLVESLIHGLIERNLISVSDALNIIETAAAADAEINADNGPHPARLRDATTVLGSISSSLQCDINARDISLYGTDRFSQND